jgi:Na+/H+ antiporter NhaD/arsenite permease-like protein
VAPWFALAVFVGVYVLLATERVHRVAAALGGAVVVLASGLVTTQDAFFSEETGVAWDVLALLLGMMVIVGILRQTGVFEYLAIWAVKRSRGRRFPVLVLLLVITAVASAFLDNVTTVILLAPVTLLVCERVAMAPVPVLVAEVLASNIGGAATLIGDPPNIIIASRSGLSFNDFLVHMLPIVTVLFVVFLLTARWLFRSALDGGDNDGAADVMTLDEREAITDAPLLRRSLLVLALVLGGFVLHGAIGTQPAIVAMAGAGLLVLLSRARPETYLDAVEWETLAFFAGIFVLVGALVKTGVIDWLAEHVASATGGDVAVSLVVMLVASAVLSAFVDNIPYVAAMTPVVSSLIAANPALGQDGALWWALALGGDLGGNATAVGASANIVVIGLARQYGHPISFGQFARYGVPVALGSVALCVPYLLLRYA